MKTRRLAKALLVTAVSVAITACSSEPTGISRNDDYLTSLLREINVSVTASGLSGGVVVPVASGGSGVCAYVAGTQSFVCAPVTFNGLTIRREYTLYDAAGHALATADPKLAASVRTRSSISGTTSTTSGGSTFSMTVDRHDETELSGLLTSTHTLNGTAAGTSTMTFGPGASGGTAVTMTVTQADTTAGLMFAVTGVGVPGRPAWPLGGSITSHVSQVQNTGTSGPQAFSYYTKIAFNGTSVVTITTSGPFGTRTCTIDMAAAAATPGSAAGVCT